MGANKEHAKKLAREQFAPYLNDFKERVIDRMEEQLVSRLDELNDKEERVIQATRDVNKSANRLRNSLDEFRNSITFYVVGYGLISSMIGGFTTFILLWFFW